MTKLQAINALVKHDHSILKPSFAKKIAKVFGLKESEIPIHKIVDTRSQFKGATIYGKKEGDKIMGVDADTLACWIATELKVKYYPMFGRGSALRECCRAVRERLEKHKN